jgi:hypothetical protein
MKMINENPEPESISGIMEFKIPLLNSNQVETGTQN